MPGVTKDDIDRAIEHLKQDIERERWAEIEQTLGVRVLVAQPYDTAVVVCDPKHPYR